ncbi:MAG: nucleotidyltransferase domain-containing protein [Cyanobacteria bacterium J06626_6]
MSVVQPIGSFIPTDSEGYLVNPCDISFVTSPWIEVVEAIEDAYLSQLGEQLVHSLYLRGSVAKGSAIAGISDIDTFCVVFSEGTKLEKAWKKEFQKTVVEQFPFQTGVEMWCIPLDIVLYKPSAKAIRATIKTQSICLWGEDLSLQIPAYKPGKELIAHSPSLKKEIDEVLETLPEMTLSTDVREECQWIMKRIVRAGFELVMVEEQSYTRDLYPCYSTFVKYFPEKSVQMQQALEWAIAPTDVASDIVQYLRSFAPWLSVATAKLVRSLDV